MKIAFSMLVSSAVALAGVVSIVSAQGTDGHKMLSPQEIKWAPGPPSIPPGAEVAVLYGDPGKDGLFAMRLKFPKGYKIAPHTHPKPEVLTVISGTFRLGMGETADPGIRATLQFPWCAAFSATWIVDDRVGGVGRTPIRKREFES